MWAALASVAGAPCSADALSDGVAKDLPALVALYKDLHRAPELSGQEVKTAARLAREIAGLGFAVTTGVGGNGIVAVMKNGDGPVLLLRTDIDGLPVKEETGLPYASTAMGRGQDGAPVPVMHACGHDMHMAAWVGTARRMAAMKPAWRGTLVMIAQPAEETVEGARAMIADGLFTRFPKPTHALAIHDSASLPAGTVGYTDGFALANVDSVNITVKGVGAHGSQPQFGIDPVLIAARTVVTLQSLVSREVDPQDAAVVTVGAINGGLKNNIIPDAVTLKLTVRSYRPDTRKLLLDGIDRIARAEATAANVPAALMPETRRFEAADATFNTPAMTRAVAAALAARLGAERVKAIAPSMAAEDFGQFHLADPKIESTIFWVGGVKQSAWDAAGGDPRKLPGLHSAKWAVDPEPTIATGVEALVTAAMSVVGASRQ
jgi:hippurate hydrolase